MPDQPLVDSLVQQGLALAATAGGELERSCWMVVHEHPVSYTHLTLPTSV